ncbi:MAG TPA: pseudouridine synthase [Xanthobacteraceae bacterium]|nr:pseudouridine synthase [Xanthobacteraceae bacterium]
MDGNNDQHKSGERIAKVIARAGLASRREAEDWIAAGRVAVNGEVIQSAALNVTERDRITVDGEPLPERERTRLFLYHKPRGLITTHADPQGRPTIFQKLSRSLPRLISVGRLDFNTEGLLLLTNDGELARVLELPATGWLRRYRVRAHGTITQGQLDALRSGITISGIHYGAIEAAIDRVQGTNLWLTFAIREGKNREVRTILAHLGLEVTRLIRVSFGPFQLAELEEGAVEEVRTRVLREQLGDKLIVAAELDFSAPVTARAESDAPRRAERKPRETTRVTPWSKKSGDERPKQKRRSKGAEHAWRARDDERPAKKLQRRFHGTRDDAARTQPQGKLRASALTDRKGRRVAVERYGEPPVPDTSHQGFVKGERFGEQKDRRPGKGPSKGASKGPPKSSGRRRAPDRARGARPHRPKGK